MIHFFVGTKAQLIKIAPIMRSLQDKSIDYNYIQSGQHKDTMEDILDNFRLEKKPDFYLYEGDDITGIAQMSRWMLQILTRYGKSDELSRIFRNDRKGVVINHGDTVSTLLGSCLARKCGLKSAHVESGLRSFNLLHPFPEELTRLLTFRLSDYFFAPGKWAMENLAGYSGIRINTHHNTLYDSLQVSPAHVPEDKPYALISIHRFENIFSRKRLAFIVDSLLAANDGLAKRFILHKPTRKKLLQYGLYEKLEMSPLIELHPRYDYFTFVSMLKGAQYLISDGGSNQEECFYLGKPCLLMRKASERKEGLGHNVILSKYDSEVISDFMAHYGRYVRPPLQLQQSPTEIIVRTLIDAGLAAPANPAA